MSIGIGMMIGGALIAVLGLLLLFNHSGTAKIVTGLLLACVGLGCLGIGYTLDQKTEVTYTVVEITDVSVRDDNKQYRVTLKGANGTETWIYVNDNQLYRFPKEESVTLLKSELKSFRDQKTTS